MPRLDVRDHTGPCSRRMKAVRNARKSRALLGSTALTALTALTTRLLRPRRQPGTVSSGSPTASGRAGVRGRSLPNHTRWAAPARSITSRGFEQRDQS